MTDDRSMADLLGAAPSAPDPSFRVDVFARIAARARRRAALKRACLRAGGFALIGLAVPTAGAFGVSFADVQPLLIAAAALGVAYLAAAVTIEGPRTLLARSRAVLR